MLTEDELKQLRELCDAATDGPWWVSDDGLNDVWNGEEEFAENLIAPGCVRHGEAPSERIRADQDFIAAARTALPQLLDEIDRLKKEAGCHKCSSCNTTTADAYGTQLMVETSELRDEIDRLKKELEKRDEDYCDDCAGYRGDDVYWCSC